MTQQEFNEWVIIELTRGERVAGRLSEEVIAGSTLFRLDVPSVEKREAATNFYPMASVYCVYITTEKVVRHAAKGWFKDPAALFRLDDGSELGEPINF